MRSVPHGDLIIVLLLIDLIVFTLDRGFFGLPRFGFDLHEVFTVSMSKVFDFTGGDDFFPGGFTYPTPKDSSVFSSRHVDVYFPRKRSRVSAPFVLAPKPKIQPSIEILPDECLFEVFRRLSEGQERSACASVSKRWLMLLSTIKRDETCVKPAQLIEQKKESPPQKSAKQKGEFVDSNDEEYQVTGLEGFLSRSLEGKKATDLRLAAIAVGTAGRGGLGKLSIRGNSSTRVTDLGLKSIARGCPSLRVLSLWNLPSIGDEGLVEIASGARFLEKLDLSHCPGVTDKGLLAIATNCPDLKLVTIESCSNIGNGALQALGIYCKNLKSLIVKNCPLVGDQGVTSLFTSAGHVLTKGKFQGLNISDASLAVMGHYATEMTDLAFVGLQNVNERGFWVMGKGQGLQKLKTLSIVSCRGVTDSALETLGNGCPNLKAFSIKNCPLVSDNGIVKFAKCAAASLESLQLEECHRITQCGVLGVLFNAKLKALALANCLGVRDLDFGFTSTPLCHSLRSLTIRNCPGFGDANLAILGTICPKLTHLDLGSLPLITDTGLLPLVQSSESGLVKINLNGCVNLTDKSVALIASLHGETLELLNLDGCKYITDSSIFSLARNCSVLNELDVSKCNVTDAGLGALAGAVHLNLQILSLSNCPLLSDKSLPFLGSLGKTLVGLNIQQSHGFSTSSIDMLLEHLWRCDILY